MDHIEGGFYLKARRVQETWIAKAPPHIREIWDWILLKANYQDNGKIKRGQLLTTYSEIQDGLAWFVGYRKETYKKHHCEIAMKALTRELMITTTKTTRGLIVTVLNYNKYQNPKNYECYTENDNETTRVLQPTDTIRKERKKEVKDKSIVGQNKPAAPSAEIVQYLNEKSGKEFKASTKATRQHIAARMKEGFSLSDFQTVIDFKVDEWGTDAKMMEFIRPQTLFGTKFESYLEAAKVAGYNGQSHGMFSVTLPEGYQPPVGSIACITTRQ